MKFLPYKTFCENFYEAEYKLNEFGYLCGIRVSYDNMYYEEGVFQLKETANMEFGLEFSGFHPLYKRVSIYIVNDVSCDLKYMEKEIQEHYIGLDCFWLNAEYIKFNYKEYK